MDLKLVALGKEKRKEGRVEEDAMLRRIRTKGRRYFRSFGIIQGREKENKREG